MSNRSLLIACLFALAAAFYLNLGPPLARASGAYTDTDMRDMVTIAADKDAAADEVLCPSSGTAIATGTLAQRRSISFQNLGPNNIFVMPVKAGTAAPTVATVLAKGKRILPGDELPRDVRSGIVYYCGAVTAIQVTGAGTRVEELR